VLGIRTAVFKFIDWRNELYDLMFLLVWEVFVSTYLNIALIITSIALIASVILQSKGAGLGGLTGGDAGGVFSARRGIEKTLFRVTIGLSVLFFSLAIASVIVTA
jgi:preprotein translocase subunit SecG